MTPEPPINTHPHRSPWAFLLGVALLGAAALSAMSASTLAEAASDEFLYNGPGMIAAVVASAVIAAGLALRGLALIARPRPLRGRPWILAATLAAALAGPIAAWGLYLGNCMLKC